MRQVAIYDHDDGGKVKLWSISESLYNKLSGSVRNESFGKAKDLEIKRDGQNYEVKLKLSLFEKSKRWAKRFFTKIIIWLKWYYTKKTRWRKYDTHLKQEKGGK